MAIRRVVLAGAALFSFLFLFATPFNVGRWEKQSANVSVNLRGLNAVSKEVVWAGGMKGTVVRSANGGRDWQVISVPDAAELDFRDIEGFDANTAIVMSSGPGKASRFYQTSDAGATWSLLYTNADPDGFFDCMAWWDRDHGIVLGDPVEDSFVILMTADGGKTWERSKFPRAQSGESAFAASGSCLTIRGDHIWFGTGGASIARVYQSRDRGKTWSSADVPIVAETVSAGIFSLAFCDDEHGVAVGGDYKVPGDGRFTAAYTSDGGLHWRPSSKYPSGYRSGVSCVPNTQGKLMIAVGTNGSDYSTDFGVNWAPMDKANYNAVSFSAGTEKRTYDGWVVGPDGMVGKYVGAQ